jgi:hypothetical protein
MFVAHRPYLVGDSASGGALKVAGAEAGGADAAADGDEEEAAAAGNAGAWLLLGDGVGV